MAHRRNTARIFAALSAANEAILRTTSEQELFQRVCDAAFSGGQFVFTAAMLVGPDKVLRIVAGAGDTVEDARSLTFSVEESSEHGEGLSATAFRTGRPAIANDYFRDPRFARRHCEAKRFGVRSAAAVPIKKNGTSIGVMLFCFEKPDMLDEETVQLLDRMVDNVSFALDNFELEQRRRQSDLANERLAKMFAALSTTNEAIMRATTRTELCQIVSDAAVLSGNFTVVGIALADPDRKTIRTVAAAGPGAERTRGLVIPVEASHPGGQGVTGTAFRSARPCISNDYLADENFQYYRSLVQSISTLSLGAWPLLRDGLPIGLLIFTSGEVGTFTPELVALFQRLADNVSFALTNFDRAEEKKLADERINYLATHDGLTGLPNRVLFSQLLNATIESSRRHSRQFALLFVDLDRFKIINDTLGHASGDALLVEMGKRFAGSIRSSDTVARLGGDEFIIILQEIADAQQAAEIARKILSAAIKPILLGDQECRVTASIGVAMFDADGCDDATLMKNADLAMYQAKDEGKNNVRFYSSEMKAPPTERLMLEASLRHALERDEFVLHYQPKRDLRTGQVTGVEALLRWNHPDLGFLPPNQFIPLAEETGLIIPLGLWVLKTACRQNMAWQRQGLAPMSMAINLSPRQFTHDGLLESITQVLAETGMPPALLQLEITESMVMQNMERAIEVLKALKNEGVQLAIDDFGTGYSSMSFIKRFPVDTLKIDRSFVRDLPQDSDDKAIADAIIGLGRALGLTIIAEGVETTEQETFLRDHACDEMQGFLFSKAVPAEEMIELLRIPRVTAPALQPELTARSGRAASAPALTAAPTDTKHP